jgi:hypothetical protein
MSTVTRRIQVWNLQQLISPPYPFTLGIILLPPGGFLRSAAASWKHPSPTTIVDLVNLEAINLRSDRCKPRASL